MDSFADLASKHRVAIEEVRTGKLSELPEDAYQDFYVYYLHRGEMPYGTAKARTGDPYHWVNYRVANDMIKYKVMH